jgi:hypothetical protein
MLRAGVDLGNIRNLLLPLGVNTSSPSAWYAMVEKMQAQLKVLADESCANALEREIAATETYVVHNRETRALLGPGPVKAVMIAADGVYTKRSYGTRPGTAKGCMVGSIGVETNEFVSYDIQCSGCSECTRAVKRGKKKRSKLADPSQHPGTTCYRTWWGSSPAMEREGSCAAHERLIRLAEESKVWDEEHQCHQFKWFPVFIVRIHHPMHTQIPRFNSTAPITPRAKPFVDSALTWQNTPNPNSGIRR